MLVTYLYKYVSGNVKHACRTLFAHMYFCLLGHSTGSLAPLILPCTASAVHQYIGGITNAIT